MVEAGDQDALQQATAAIQALSADYVAKLPGKLDEVERSWAVLCNGPWSPEALRELHRAVHGIKGSGKIFGLPQVSTAAATLEAALEALMERSDTPAADDLARVSSALAELRLWLPRLAERSGREPGQRAGMERSEGWRG